MWCGENRYLTLPHWRTGKRLQSVCLVLSVNSPFLNLWCYWQIFSEDIKGKRLGLLIYIYIYRPPLISPRATAATPRCSAKAWLTSWWGPTLSPAVVRDDSIRFNHFSCPFSDKLLVSRVKFRFDKKKLDFHTKDMQFWWKQCKCDQFKWGFHTDTLSRTRHESMNV